MTDAEEYAEILQQAKANKADVAEDMISQKRGFSRWVLSIPHRLFAWAERVAREKLQRR